MRREVKKGRRESERVEEGWWPVFGHVERGHSGIREWRGHGGGRRVENLLMARSEWREKSYGGWSRRGGGDGQSGRRKVRQ
ncbi:hypothetical protein OsI_14893 [Oryza sativa Indica Group]|uniref:Uncharacterized protein n=1 Tax=Oryza sativa subsp. indica TaxID=39946 RepID=B8AVC1_ORYSI|nr:hypothetical protein OsI_14893 [Oryza sativa Indica Group]